jgi:hypothetical protein
VCFETFLERREEFQTEFFDFSVWCRYAASAMLCGSSVFGAREQRQMFTTSNGAIRATSLASRLPIADIRGCLD